MGTVTGLTAARMLEIEAACIVAGAVSLGPGPTTDHLILIKHDGSTVDAGNVRGPQGIPGVAGPTGPGINWRGTWNPGTAYAVGDGVYYLGTSYRRLVAGTTATTPDADVTNWGVVALKGTDGAPSNTPIEAWHFVGAAGEPAFQNGWVNYDATRLVRYRKFPDGRVRLSGLLKNGVAGSIAFTLPAGYRPTQEGYYSVVSNGAFGAVIIDAAGQVTPAIGSSTYYFLDGIEFDTGQSIFPASIVSVTQEGWHTVGAAGEPAFQNSWVGRAPEPPRFRKTPDGEVTIEGIFDTGVSGATAFTLPVGYRPDRNEYSVQLGDAGAAAYALVGSDGTVQLTRSAASVFAKIKFWVPQTTFPAGQASTPVVTVLPNTPMDGDEIYYQTASMKTDGLMWRLRYDTTAPGLYKWIPIGGPGPLYHEIGNSETIAQVAFGDLTTVGPFVTCPLAGDYLFSVSLDGYSSIADAAPYAALKFGAAAVSGGDRMFLFRPGNASGQGNKGGFGGRSVKRTVLAAGTVVKLQYANANAATTVSFENRVLTATPIRVG
jgi:hypothetical protein